MLYSLLLAEVPITKGWLLTLLSDTSKVYVPPSCKSKVTALCAKVALSAEFLNLYLLPLSDTTTTLYVFVGVAPPAAHCQATVVAPFVLESVWVLVTSAVPL